MLEAEGVYYQAGRLCLTQDVSLKLNPGELVTIIGPNGAGKSTLLRLLTGYLRPSQGECRLMGKRLSEWCPHALARTRAVMRQHSGLAFPFSVRDVVTMGRFPYGNGVHAFGQSRRSTAVRRGAAAGSAGPRAGSAVAT